MMPHILTHAPMVYSDKVCFVSCEKMAEKSGSLLTYEIEPKHRYGFAQMYWKSSLQSNFQADMYVTFNKYLLKKKMFFNKTGWVMRVSITSEDDEDDEDAKIWYFISLDIGKLWNGFLAYLTSGPESGITVFPDAETAQEYLRML
jgi:hypothetical protein